MTHTVSTRQLVGQSYTVRVDGTTVGIVSKRGTGASAEWSAVAGHDKLGRFPTRVEAVGAVADRSGLLPS